MKSAIFYALLVFAANFALISAADCECSDDNISKEAAELWDFLASDEIKDNEGYPVIPGELSLLIPCGNCIEKNRRKRKIEEMAKKERAREERSPAFFRVWRHADESRNKCPLGYRRVSFMCVAYNQ